MKSREINERNLFPLLKHYHELIIQSADVEKKFHHNPPETPNDEMEIRQAIEQSINVIKFLSDIANSVSTGKISFDAISKYSDLITNIFYGYKTFFATLTWKVNWQDSTGEIEIYENQFNNLLNKFPISNR